MHIVTIVPLHTELGCRTRKQHKKNWRDFGNQNASYARCARPNKNKLLAKKLALWTMEWPRRTTLEADWSLDKVSFSTLGSWRIAKQKGPAGCVISAPNWGKVQLLFGHCQSRLRSCWKSFQSVFHLARNGFGSKFGSQNDPRFWSFLTSTAWIHGIQGLVTIATARRAATFAPKACPNKSSITSAS